MTHQETISREALQARRSKILTVLGAKRDTSIPHQYSVYYQFSCERRVLLQFLSLRNEAYRLGDSSYAIVLVFPRQDENERGSFLTISILQLMTNEVTREVARVSYTLIFNENLYRTIRVGQEGEVAQALYFKSLEEFEVVMDTTRTYLGKIIEAMECDTN